VGLGRFGGGVAYFSKTMVEIFGGGVVVCWGCVGDEI
jgi:hypothetical protein